MTQANRAPARLPPERVFVVQFYAYTTLDTIRMSGRIEPVVSGQARHSHSLATLLDFITHVLAEGETVGKAET